MRSFFDRKPDERSIIFAEAQGLIDDGVDLDFVLGIFPDDAEWLRDELQFTSALEAAYESEQPSYFFEASLKSKFLAAAREPARPPVATPAASFRTVFASMSVAAAALGVGVVTLGFVTAGSSVPGDWNYSFKLANERLQYTLSSGDDRVNIQLRQTEVRVEEIQRLSSRGDLSAGDLDRLNNEAHALAVLARNQPLDGPQKARVAGIAGTGAAVLKDVSSKQPELEVPANAAAAALGDAAVTALATPTPTPSPTPSATPTRDPKATPAGTVTASGTAAVTTPASTAATATATGAASPAASASPTANGSPAATVSPSPAP
jgi:hypothetical protein